MPKWLKRSLWTLSAIAGLLVVAVNFQMIGVFRKSIIEELDEPYVVVGCSPAGLLTTDGGVVLLPEIDRVPCGSSALKAAIEHGIEVEQDGRVIGLVRVWHWCGNDPIGEHLARVDISHMLTFRMLMEAHFAPLGLRAAEMHRYAFSEYGWSVGEFYTFQNWLRSTEVPAS